MKKNLRNIRDIAALGTAFFVLSTIPGQAYLDPGSGSMLLTAILGLLAATTYTLKGYFHRVTGMFRRNRSETGDDAGQKKD